MTVATEAKTPPAYMVAPVGTTFEIVLEGDSNAERRDGREPVVVSQCAFRINTDTGLEACIAKLRESDEALAANPDRRYDWQQTMVAHLPEGGGLVCFAVSWYDVKFFEERRDVFAGGMHRRMYEQFGIAEGDFTVTHWSRA